jgi:hypothetical protein
MTVSHRKLFFAFMIIVLVTLNAWRWWPSSVRLPDETRRSLEGFGTEDFKITAMPVNSLPPMSRDIFTPKKIVIRIPKIKAVPTVAQTLPEKSPEEMARDSAQAEFSIIRCVGVSVRNGHMQAYLINAGEYSLVSNGDIVGGHFVVEKIVADGVYLRDPKLGVGGLISISGK